ncbi:PilT protein domain protein [Thiorhodococcus drewsii AZ1]|uniref:Ribonuclease VapC n=1 Tax=Thiorhodococcus drewsii AZ1 TaxID=765913 RepID=G2E8J3_9GAMM|nr:type II toxin-antitoxin system VapC family toxin [Thiorhodococcus drewsii]EGV27579.1 PilT protein domain protein [Thiorhodococcus drewsii AZ1]
MPKPAYLLDTNILSDLIRQPAGRIRDRIAQYGEDSICTSIVVASELRFGAAKKGSARLSAQMEAVLSAISILPLDEPTDRHYAEIRHALESAGTPIGANDLLIAAHARALGRTLVTANEREFRRVPGLIVENWLAD